VEFLLDKDGRFYFIEVNSRLQVEHPVTEAVTGIDLVGCQIDIAQGLSLKKILPSAARSNVTGSAIEVRLCAESPEKGFLTSTGTLLEFLTPRDSSLRVDTGFETGSKVTHFYDSLLAKLIVHTPDRRESIDLLLKKLKKTVIFGVETNQGFLESLLRSPDFADARHSTSTTEKILALSKDNDGPRFLAAALHVAGKNLLETTQQDPWISHPGFRLGGMGKCIKTVEIDGSVFEVEFVSNGRADVTVSVRQFPQGESNLRSFSLSDLRRHPAIFGPDGWIKTSLGTFQVLRHARAAKVSSRTGARVDELVSPLPGKVLEIRVKSGAKVSKGETLAVIESMKMEHPLLSPEQSVIGEVRVSPGELIEAKATILTFKH